MNFLKTFLKLTTWKRLLISIFMIIAAILSIVFGSVFYLSNHTHKSIEYGGGNSVLVQVKSDKKIDLNKTNEISRSISSRLTDGSGYNGIDIKTEAEGKILISKSGHLSQKELFQFINDIVKKPNIVATTTNINPLFKNKRFEVGDSIDFQNVKQYQIPFKLNGAEYIERNGFNTIKISLNGIEGQTEYAKATDYLQRSNNREILFWLNIDNLYNRAINDYSKDWENSGKNLWNFIHTNNQVNTAGQNGRQIENSLKDNELRIQRDYLIYRGSINFVHDSSDVYINSQNLSNSQAKSLVERINFALSDYDLELLSTKTYSDVKDNSSFLYAMIGSLIAFSLLAFLQIFNYGLLGVATTISMALYSFLTLVIFIAVRGEYSPTLITALLLGLLVLFDGTVVWFEKFKGRMSTGDSINKSFTNTLKYNTRRVVDTNLMLFISMLIMFYLGLREIKTFSSFSFFGILVSLFVSQIFLRWVTISLTKWDLLEKKPWLFGLTNFDKKINNAISNKNINFLKNAKYVAISSLILLLITTIIIGVLSGITNNFWTSFNSSKEFLGGYSINIYSSNNNSFFDSIQADKLLHKIAKENPNIKNLNDISLIYSINGVDQSKGISIYLNEYDKNIIDGIQKSITSFNENLSLIHYKLSNATIINSLIWLIVGILVSAIIIAAYILLRFGWTFSVLFLFGLFFDLIFLIIIITLTRVLINSYLITIIASLFVWSVNEKLSIISEIKENIKFKYHKQILDKDEIVNIANLSLSKKIKRNIVILFAICIISIGVIIALPIYEKLLGIVIIISLAFSTLLTSYLALWIWTKIYTISQTHKQRRIDSGFWNINKIEEQTFNGINDYF
ncbi:preprotein translocase subunit SecD [Mycoplasmopsis cynos]|uniref:Bifunctional preprotein translocase subunit SecD/SecF n=1 Tax=Mycoplasmopsis cynos TaxID=171284 RepID=A0A449AI58_9BACT|nr:preprotein translocase subunit SecD [Mycoplasmopsis cynos]WQQ18149.1 preprotein translocase subunit SecD [Mycoplasmopsis cynos]VEU64677.1 bifunctional preprotein translocase subunit SecD/SecF [Mycoplasmopsis cynos]